MALFDWIIGRNNNQTPQLEPVIIEDPNQPQLTQQLQNRIGNNSVTDKTRFKPFQDFFNKIADVDNINEPIETPSIKIGNFYNDRIKPLGDRIATGILGEKINPYIETDENTYTDLDEDGNTRLNTAIGNPVRIGGIINDWRAGFNDNYRNGFDISNLADDRKKSLAYRFGEGIGTLGRFAQSPLGRGLIVAGLVGATGGGALPALTFGGMTSMLNQKNRFNDRLYRNELEKLGVNIPDLKGYVSADTYKKLVEAERLRDNADFKKMYYDAQLKNQQDMMEFRKQQAEQEKRQQAIDNAYKQQTLNENIRHNRNSEAVDWGKINVEREKIKNKNTQNKNITKETELNEIDNQLKEFENTFTKMEQHPYRYRMLGRASELANMLTEEEANFNAQRTLLFNQIARKLGGEKGVLSDKDIERIDKALPTLSDTIEQKRAKLKAVYSLLDIKRSSLTEENNDPLGLGL